MIALTLGPVLFADFEIPAQIGFGGEQRLAVHELPGGGRVVDTLGPQPTDIVWSGIFTGGDATSRARTLDRLRMAGGALALSWDVFCYSVTLRSFTAEYRNPGWVPYRISCTVLADEAQLLVSLAESLGADLLSDIGSALGFSPNPAYGLATAQTLLAAPGGGIAGTAAALAAGAALGGAQASVAAGLASAGAALLVPPMDAVGVAGVAASAGTAAALAASNAFLGRAAANLLGG